MKLKDSHVHSMYDYVVPLVAPAGTPPYVLSWSGCVFLS
jgi:hypothetical protein